MFSDFVPPPAGWAVFGTNLDHQGHIEFSSQLDDAGMPLWERPIYTPDAQTAAPEVAPCNQPNPEPDTTSTIDETKRTTCKDCGLTGDHTWWCSVGADEVTAGSRRYFWRD